jgi:cytochrome c-type biogenesis protein CcmH
MSRIPLWLRYLALGVILAVALVIGSNVFSPAPPTPQQRVASLEATLKCPSCQDLSVAQSASPSSLAVRAEIVRSVHQGLSNEEITAKLQARYGTTVLLTPPAGGLSVVLWLVPLLLVVGIAGIPLAVMATRRARRSQPSQRS